LLTLPDDWAATFHRIPKILDTEFEGSGATRIAEIGLGDVADGDIFNHFDKWQDEQLWSSLGGEADASEESGVEIEIDTDARRSTLRQDVKEAVVISNQVLTAEGEPEKRHIALRLPTGMPYSVGDYLAVLPINDQKNIRRVLKHYGLPWDAMLTIKVGANTTLPTGHPISATDVLGAYVELSQPATRKVCTKLRLTSCTSSPLSRTLHGLLLAYQTKKPARKCLLLPGKTLILRFPRSAVLLWICSKNIHLPHCP
jgi:cytochrome P450/NADPH-cytochrome P450 reductase